MVDYDPVGYDSVGDYICAVRRNTDVRASRTHIHIPYATCSTMYQEPSDWDGDKWRLSIGCCQYEAIG